MGQVIISSAPTELNSGLLQLQGGVAMSSTLTTVTDQNNNASPLKLSTTQVQTLSTLKITTADNPYIDAEDNSGNNRFTVGRDPSSQQVNVDFASNPTGSTTNVGAIRTYQDGTNLSEVMTFREDGLLTIAKSIQFSNYNQTIGGGGIPLSAIYSATLGLCSLIQDSGGGGIKFTDSGGSAYAKMGFGNLNTTIGQSTYGVVPDLGARLGVRGSGSTSATTSLLVQNSAGTRLLEQKDNGEFYIGSTATNTGVIYVPHESSYGTRTFLAIQNGGASLMSTVSNSQLLLNGGMFNAGSLYLTDINLGVVGKSAFSNNNTSIVLSSEVNAYNGVNQNDASNLVYIKNRGTTLQANGSVNWIKMDGTVNEAGGGGAKWCTGIYYNPTLTGGTLLANSHYCYHATSGQMMVNTTSPQSSAQLQVDSTTRGFLPPRMTDAQIRAIASPVNGLVAYNTDINHLCCYQAGAWVKFSHSPM